MKWLRTITVLALAVFWLPVSVHCQLEQLPGLEFLSCCDHEDTTAPHQDDDCEGDACAVVEAGLYKSEERQVALPAPMIESANGPALSVAPITISTGTLPLLANTAPPELPRFWQFSLRAALPIRAPSRAA